MNDRTASFPQLQPTDERTAPGGAAGPLPRHGAVKIVDLDDPQASSQPLAATKLTVGGIVKHLAFVEYRWFVGK